MITVIHKNHERLFKDVFYVGRPSPLGNPFTHKKYNTRAPYVVETRAQAIENYKSWLWNEMKKETSPAKAMLEELVDYYMEHHQLALSCWCDPKPCHAEVIRMAILYLVSRKLPNGERKSK